MHGFIIGNIGETIELCSLLFDKYVYMQMLKLYVEIIISSQSLGSTRCLNND